jgi:hypothetical protein
VCSSDLPQHTKEELAELIEKQRKHRELMDRLNAKFSRPGAWTIGQELGELHIGVGIVNAVSEQPPRAARWQCPDATMPPVSTPKKADLACPPASAGLPPAHALAVASDLFKAPRRPRRKATQQQKYSA